jgi:hypothetical protein
MAVIVASTPVDRMDPMSETGSTSGSQEPAPAATGPGRYERTSGGLVGAMLVTVLAVLAFVAFRAVTTDKEPTPVRAVDYASLVTSARADERLFILAPSRLPLGWKATSATYAPGAQPTWHLGTLTDDGKYVGVEEARTSIEDLVEEHVDVGAERGRDVTIAGETWQTWTDEGGDYAVARSHRAGGETVESWLVVGTAAEDEVRDFAASLEGAPARSAG